MDKKKAYQNYKVQRYLFFWLAIAAYFVPYIAATAALLPFVKAESGVKWGIGLAVTALNALPLIGGIFRNLTAHIPFINVPAILFILLAGFFTLDIFRAYRFTFMTIEAAACAGGLAASVLWIFHRRYKAKAQVVRTVIKSGLISG